MVRFFHLLSVALLLSGGCRSSDDYLERVVREHAGDQPVAGAALLEDTSHVSIVTEEVVYAVVNGNPVRGYLARPEKIDADVSGIVVIHEWWGLNENIREMTRKLAHAGYVALAVDVYGGKVAETPEKARTYVIEAMRREAKVRENLRQAYRYLTEKQGISRVGVIGWCFGGGWALQMALVLPDRLDAVVIYYGRLVTDPELLRRLQMPVLGIFGAEDRSIPVETVHRFQAVLDSLGKVREIYIYPGAGHAFANPSGTRYAPEAAVDAWKKTLTFLDQYLKHTQ